MKKSRSYVYGIFFAFGVALLIAGLKILHEADFQGYFVDETTDNSVAAFQFLKSGNYTTLRFSKSFDPEISSGLFATWISGIVWVLKGSLFTQRLLVSLWCWAQALALFFVFFRKKLKTETSLFWAAILWLFCLRLPYWHGFILNLGELQGALCIGWGMFFLFQRPQLAFFLFGLAVWSCKVIYSPFVFFLGLAYVWNLKGSNKQKAVQTGKAVLFFLTPLFLWLFIIALKTDIKAALLWPLHLAQFVVHGPSGLDGTSVVRGLWERLEVLEWHTYSLSEKFKFCFLLFGPALFYLGLRWKKKSLTSIENALSLASIAALLMYAAWWFLTHPAMFARHIQPALYVGLGFFAYWFSVLAWSAKKQAHTIFYFLTFLFLATEVTALWKRGPLLREGESYPRNCTKTLFQTRCIPEINEYLGNLNTREDLDH